MGKSVAAYFDLDGTLLDASSEKTLTAYLGRKRPWRIPYGAVAWTFGLVSNLLRGRAFYDAARNRGHFSLASWTVLEKFSNQIATNNLSSKISKEARDSLKWHKSQGHRVVLVTATIAPMAEAMGEVLGWMQFTAADQMSVKASSAAQSAVGPSLDARGKLLSLKQMP